MMEQEEEEKNVMRISKKVKKQATTNIFEMIGGGKHDSDGEQIVGAGASADEHEESDEGKEKKKRERKDIEEYF